DPAHFTGAGAHAGRRDRRAGARLRAAARGSGAVPPIHRGTDPRGTSRSACFRLGRLAMRHGEAGMIRYLFRLTGKVSRERYFAIGVLLFAIKYALDYTLATVVLHRSWTLFTYLDPLREMRGMSAMLGVDRQY